MVFANYSPLDGFFLLFMTATTDHTGSTNSPPLTAQIVFFLYWGLDSRFIALKLAYFSVYFFSCRELKEESFFLFFYFYRWIQPETKWSTKKRLKAFVQMLSQRKTDIKMREHGTEQVYERLSLAFKSEGEEASFNGNCLWLLLIFIVMRRFTEWNKTKGRDGARAR